MQRRSPYGFIPRTRSDAGMRVAPSYLEDYLQSTAHNSISGTEVLANNPDTTYTPTGHNVDQRVSQILQATYPVPFPVTLVLYTAATSTRFFAPAHILAVENDYPFGEFVDNANQTGRYLVEWGVADARAQCELDLSHACLYLPGVTTVSVRATVFNLREDQQVTAHAVAIPGMAPEQQYGTFSQSIYQLADRTVTGIQRQTFAREVSVSVGGDSVDGFDMASMSAVAIGRETTGIAVGQWAGSFAAPSEPAFIPANVATFDLAARNMTAPSGLQNGIATLTQHIRVA